MAAMLSILFTSPLAFAILAAGLLLAITIHEFAHAWVADRLGDPTPRVQGRVTLNPRAHLDPIGTMAILITRFGWGKPVQFDPYNLQDPLRDTALISLAGPASNLVMAALLGVVVRLAIFPEVVGLILTYVITINVALALFNLIPIHPLDGSKIILALLPAETALEYDHFMRRYGILVLILLILPWNGVSPASQLIWPAIEKVVSLLVGF